MLRVESMRTSEVKADESGHECDIVSMTFCISSLFTDILFSEIYLQYLSIVLVCLFYILLLSCHLRFIYSVIY